MLKIEVTLISGRTSQQGAGLEVGKTSEEYFRSTSYVELNASDAEKLGVGDEQPVGVTTAFFPYGPWANQVFGTDTVGTGMPSYKGVRATVEPATGKPVPTLTELVERLRGGGR
jgi:formylmethanofuran dehydrogenase subunit D